MIDRHLTQIEALEAAVADLEARLQDTRAPFRAATTRLMPLPGVSHTGAAVLIAEIGDDLSRFPPAGPRLSGAGLCPRLDERAGQRRSTRTRQRVPWLKPVPVPAAGAATRKQQRSGHGQLLVS